MSATVGTTRGSAVVYHHLLLLLLQPRRTRVKFSTSRHLIASRLRDRSPYISLMLSAVMVRDGAYESRASQHRRCDFQNYIVCLSPTSCWCWSLVTGASNHRQQRHDPPRSQTWTPPKPVLAVINRQTRRMGECGRRISARSSSHSAVIDETAAMVLFSNPLFPFV